MFKFQRIETIRSVQIYVMDRQHFIRLHFLKFPVDVNCVQCQQRNNVKCSTSLSKSRDNSKVYCHQNISFVVALFSYIIVFKYLIEWLKVRHPVRISIPLTLMLSLPGILIKLINAIP